MDKIAVIKPNPSLTGVDLSSKLSDTEYIALLGTASNLLGGHTSLNNTLGAAGVIAPWAKAAGILNSDGGDFSNPKLREAAIRAALFSSLPLAAMLGRKQGLDREINKRSSTFLKYALPAALAGGAGYGTYRYMRPKEKPSWGNFSLPGLPNLNSDTARYGALGMAGLGTLANLTGVTGGRTSSALGLLGAAAPLTQNILSNRQKGLSWRESILNPGTAEAGVASLIPLIAMQARRHGQRPSRPLL